MPRHSLPASTRSRLAEQLFSDYAGVAGVVLRGELRERVLGWVDSAFSAVPREEQAFFTRRDTPTEATVLRVRSMPARDLWTHAIAKVVLRAALKEHHPAVSAATLERFELWLSAEPIELQRRLLGAALRVAIKRVHSGDPYTLTVFLNQFVKETAMAEVKFYIDDSAIAALKDPEAKAKYLSAISIALVTSFGMSQTDADIAKSPRAASIVGFLLLDEEYDPKSLSFFDSFKRAWIESLGKTPYYAAPNESNPPKEVANDAVYRFVSETIVELNGGKPDVSYQELAAVARHAIQLSDTIPFNHPNFIASVRIGLDAYVGGKPTGDSLTLPAGSLPGTGDETADEAELNGSNIGAFGTVYAIALLHRTNVFNVVDRITELFMNGLLPIGFDAAGKALDAYYWDSEDRFSESARMSHFARILGLPGGEVPKEVQPNREYESLLLRFISTVAEYDRQRRVADIFDNRRPSLSLSGEQVRKSGRDLAANASLYGWGATHFVARRLNGHLTRAIEILKLPHVQKAFGVTNVWQVVERVSISEFGVTPNIVKYRTMAEASKTIFDLLARKTRELSLANSTNPFLYETNGISNDGSGDLNMSETQELLRGVQHWLAVNAVGEEQVQKYSKPNDSLVPSLPNMSGNKNAGESGEVVDRLRKLVASGSAPSLDQLQQLIPMR